MAEASLDPFRAATLERPELARVIRYNQALSYWLLWDMKGAFVLDHGRNPTHLILSAARDKEMVRLCKVEKDAEFPPYKLRGTSDGAYVFGARCTVITTNQDVRFAYFEENH